MIKSYKIFLPKTCVNVIYLFSKKKKDFIYLESTIKYFEILGPMN